MRYRILTIPVGTQSARLTVTGLTRDRRGRPAVICACVCGSETVVTRCDFANGNTRSCGCLKREVLASASRTHGLTQHPLYAVWTDMRNRCRNPRNRRYAYYGGRGITVCERWDDFTAFLEDMGPKPAPEYSIDRIDVDGDYEPSNCRWATKREQARNRRPRRRLERMRIVSEPKD